MAQKIKSVTGAEPKREGEYPAGYHVGYPKGPDCVHDILPVEQNFGTYAILWFTAYRADGSIIGKMNADHVSEVVYYPPEEK